MKMMQSDYLPSAAKKPIITLDAKGIRRGIKAMMVKLYALVWLVGIVAVAATYVTGNMTPEIALFFGFLSFGAIFMGIMGVLPSTVAEANHKH